MLLFVAKLHKKSYRCQMWQRQIKILENLHLVKHTGEGIFLYPGEERQD